MRTLTQLCALLFSFYTLAQDINIEPFATGFSSPVNIKHAGDDKLYVVERAGIIKIINADGTVNTTPFLNIDPRVINNGGEQGLLALAFHPDYINNGYFYVNYINNSGDTVISRFSRSTATTANSGSELILMTLSQPYSNHNGGDMHFGPDGFLYISTGDGGAGGDPGNRAQNLSSPLGKLLRIDVDNTDTGLNYAIPTSNPLYGSTDTSHVQEIWSYGLRNPWKFSFDRDTGDIWTADVGQGQIEEINMVSSTSNPINYGWRCYEGNSPYNTSGCPSMTNMEFPVAQYSHTGDGQFKCSITGGYRYRGSAQPTLEGYYFFADYCSDEIGYVLGNQSDTAFTLTFIRDFGSDGFSAFGEDVNGELYIVGLGSGVVYKIIDANLSVEEENIANIKMYPNPVNDVLTLDASHIAVETIRFYNLQGKLIKTITDPEADQIIISTGEMASGFYTVEVTAQNGSKQIQKLIKN